MLRKLIVMMAALALIVGCAELQPARRDAQQEFTYDYSVPGAGKDALWTRARDYFAGAYGDSKEVMRVMDQSDGVILGKGLAAWGGFGTECHTAYHIRFAAKDQKARLQLELIYGAPPLSKCTGWHWPTEHGYGQIVAQFNNLATALGSALSGHGVSDRLKNF